MEGIRWKWGRVNFVSINKHFSVSVYLSVWVAKKQIHFKKILDHSLWFISFFFVRNFIMIYQPNQIVVYQAQYHRVREVQAIGCTFRWSPLVLQTRKWWGTQQRNKPTCIWMGWLDQYYFVGLTRNVQNGLKNLLKPNLTWPCIENEKMGRGSV